jgi:hypothetical protein
VFRRSSAKFLAALAVATAVGISVPAPAAPAASRAPIQAVAARSCPAGDTPASIDGQAKCLRAGEFCKHSADRQYRRYGFRCIRYYRNVNRYRLTYA